MKVRCAHGLKVRCSHPGFGPRDRVDNVRRGSLRAAVLFEADLSLGLGDLRRSEEDSLVVKATALIWRKSGKSP